MWSVSWWAMVLWAVLAAAPLHAQAPNPAEPVGDASDPPTDEPTEAQLAAARERFREGVAAAERGRYDVAVRAFRAALEVRDAAAVRFNLASALFELREDVEAFALARGVHEDASAPADLRERATFLEREVRGRNAVVEVQLGGLADGARLGDRVLAPEELGVPILLEPGTVEVLGLRGGEIVTRRALTLRAGAEAYVDVSVVPTPAELAREEAAREERDPLAEGPGERSRVGLFVGIGAAVVAVAAVVVIAVVATRDTTEAPVRGDFEPGVIRW
ncbi:MAG: hypothetical protein MUE69_23425 [Myxococcota bacterium]|nr:hypothetical protein [Myxococcota bacterium]